MKKPKVITSVNGRFHIFEVSNELNKLGYLERIITTYPSFTMFKWGIPINKVKSITEIEILKRLLRKFPLKSEKKTYLNKMRSLRTCGTVNREVCNSEQLKFDVDPIQVAFIKY